MTFTQWISELQNHILNNWVETVSVGTLFAAGVWFFIQVLGDWQWKWDTATKQFWGVWGALLAPVIGYGLVAKLTPVTFNLVDAVTSGVVACIAAKLIHDGMDKATTLQLQTSVFSLRQQAKIAKVKTKLPASVKDASAVTEPTTFPLSAYQGQEAASKAFAITQTGTGAQAVVETTPAASGASTANGGQ